MEGREGEVTISQYSEPYLLRGPLASLPSSKNVTAVEKPFSSVSPIVIAPEDSEQDHVSSTDKTNDRIK